MTKYFVSIIFTLLLIPSFGQFTIADGMTSNCTGTLFDTGGPTGDYANNENHIFTICADPPTQCIEFTLDYYHIERGSLGFGEALRFYDGPDNTSPLIAQMEETIGSAYGGSGVCYSVRSGECLTIEFVSDAQNTFAGFKGTWQCSDTPCPMPTPIDIQTNLSNAFFESTLSTPYMETTITNIECNGEAYGYFEHVNDLSDLGIENGMVLTTGLAIDAIGPNSAISKSTLLDEPGDDDLDSLSSILGISIPSRDACIVELDVFTRTDQIQFEYVFASEEYPEWVGQFNDIFALLISGPGINDGLPQINGQKNMATIPDGSWVSVNNINAEDNWSYFQNTYNSTSMAYDGLVVDQMASKKSLTARNEVTPCETYHLKFVISDRVDGNFDSGVFISEITTQLPSISTLENQVFIEGCGLQNDSISIRLDRPAESELKYEAGIFGSATITDDYELSIPSIIVFNEGDSILTFPISIFGDDLIEGTETIEIRFTQDFGCGILEVGSLTIEIEDSNLSASLSIQDTTLCANENFQIEAILSDPAATIEWNAQGEITLSCTDCTNPEISVSENGAGTITLTLTKDDCTFETNVLIDASNYFTDVYIDGENCVLLGQEIMLDAVIDPSPMTLPEWFIDGVTTDQRSLSFSHEPSAEQTIYYIELKDPSGCLYHDSLIVRTVIPEFVLPNTFIPDNPDSDSFNLIFTYLVGADKNGDGVLEGEEFNQEFDFDIQQFTVYNRWGEAMIECQDRACAELGWDGTYKGLRQPSDVYMYVFKAILPNGDEKFLKGDVTLLR